MSVSFDFIPLLALAKPTWHSMRLFTLNTRQHQHKNVLAVDNNVACCMHSKSNSISIHINNGIIHNRIFVVEYLLSNICYFSCLHMTSALLPRSSIFGGSLIGGKMPTWRHTHAAILTILSIDCDELIVSKCRGPTYVLEWMKIVVDRNAASHIYYENDMKPNGAVERAEMKMETTGTFLLGFCTTPSYSHTTLLKASHSDMQSHSPTNRIWSNRANESENMLYRL